MSDKVYEMFWDCGFCGATKLLGKTHRHCPNCGAAQDPDARYFPSEEEKVAVSDHVYFGADWRCGNCDTPNSAAAKFCGNCGSAPDGAETVKLVHDDEQSAAPPPPPAAPEEPAKKGGAGKLLGCFAVLLIGGLIAFCAVSMLWKKSDTVTVLGHSWERTVQVEEYQSSTESDWCTDMPASARDVSKTQKEKSTKKVQDGEDCVTKNKDNGDGTFKQVEECSPRYREEPVMADWCRYSIDKWSDDRLAKAAGKGLSPTWPEANARTCTTVKIGCEREGARTESYLLSLRDSGGDVHSCSLSEARWRAFADGATLSAELRVLGGGLDCDSLKK